MKERNPEKTREPEGRIHPTAVVHKNARVDSETEIGPHAVVGPDVTIGRGCRIEEVEYSERFEVHPTSEVGKRTKRRADASSRSVADGSEPIGSIG